jgi:hypothetical protein
MAGKALKEGEKMLKLCMKGIRFHLRRRRGRFKENVEEDPVNGQPVTVLS